MWFNDIAYDPAVDLKAVENFGFIDLKSALANSVVPSQLPDTDVHYNGIDNPNSILGKPADIFDAMAMERAINEYVPPTGDKKDQ